MENSPPASAPPDQPAAHAPAAETESLLHLHKMSTTAGVGSEDYVAINATAVVAALFGLASVLAILDSSGILFVIPLVGVVLAWAALRQIRNSSGTQTGRWLAVFGLVLSGAIMIGKLSTTAYSSYHRRADQRAIADLCAKYGNLVAQRNFDQAYDLFDGDFKAHMPRATFKAYLTIYQSGRDLPPIEKVAWNGVSPDFHTHSEEGFETADAVIRVYYQGVAGQNQIGVRFRRDGEGPWLIENIPQQFPAPRSGGAPQ